MHVQVVDLDVVVVLHHFRFWFPKKIIIFPLLSSFCPTYFQTKTSFPLTDLSHLVLFVHARKLRGEGVSGYSSNEING